MELTPEFKEMLIKTLETLKGPEQRLNLIEDIEDIVDSQSQADPRFETTRLFRRISAAEVIRQLLAQKGYGEDELPSEETIRRRLDSLGYRPAKVQKSKPKKKIPETDEIFECVHLVNQDADAYDDELRTSMDVKATVKLGPLSRGGKSRVPVQALDHDFDSEQELKPVGILLPDSGETYISFVTSTVRKIGCSFPYHSQVSIHRR